MQPLNPASPLPLYRQLADSLSAAIQRGIYPPGEKLPSEPNLAERFGVTRPTVRQATRLLAERRLVEARRGAGTFVCAPRAEVDLFSLGGTLEAFEQQGLSLQRRLLGKVHEVRVAKECSVNPFSGRVAYHFKRLSRIRERAVLLEEFYADPRLFPELEAFDLSVKSFARVVREHYFQSPSGGKQTFQVCVPDGSRARSLELAPATAVLLVRRTLDFPSAPGALYVELFCRTDEFVFTQTLEA